LKLSLPTLFGNPEEYVAPEHMDNNPDEIEGVKNIRQNQNLKDKNARLRSELCKNSEEISRLKNLVEKLEDEKRQLKSKVVRGQRIKSYHKTMSWGPLALSTSEFRGRGNVGQIFGPENCVLNFFQIQELQGQNAQLFSPFQSCTLRSGHCQLADL
jgi:hypothetical protein